MPGSYDLIVIGGGIAGSTTAAVMASEGSRVLLLERSTTFTDRVRGEQMYPWGVVQARRLGVYEHLVPHVARELRLWTNHVHGAPPSAPRDLQRTTPSGSGFLTFYHPAMQQALLDAAAEAGAEVRRGATAVGIEVGPPGTVVSRIGARERRDGAALIVGADGRDSRIASLAGFERQRDRDGLRMAGVSMLGMSAPEDHCQVFFRPDRGLIATLIPVGGSRFRVYLSRERRDPGAPFSGKAALGPLREAWGESGAPAAWFDGAEQAGPLAEFDGTDTWIRSPYRDGVALIGDAAAATDPSFGSGLALTLRDVANLTDALKATPQLERAGRSYAAAHDRDYGAVHRLVGWLTEMYARTGPEADALRARAFPRLAGEPRRAPDLIGVGPDAPSDDAARRRFFALDDDEADPT